MILGVIGSWQIVILLIVLVIPILTLIDIFRHEFPGQERLLWALIVAFAPLFGTLIYLAFGRKRRIKK